MPIAFSRSLEKRYLPDADGVVAAVRATLA